jgi:hypothetical protein
MKTHSQPKPRTNQQTGAAVEGVDSIFSDMLEPSIRYRGKLSDDSALPHTEREVTRSSLSELTAPRRSYRIAFNEFLD